MPTGGSDVDNFSSGGIAAPVDLDTARLGCAVAKYPNAKGDFFESHPDTGGKIKGREVPCWAEVCDLVRSAHAKLDKIPSVGWDVAITKEGPVLIEGNVKWGSQIFEIPHGRPLTSTDFPAYYRHWTGEDLEIALERR